MNSIDRANNYSIGTNTKMDKKVPKKLYKYRDLSPRTLHMIVSDEVYYADPSTFNDPFDSRPNLKVDLDVAELREVLRKFVERRITEEMSAAAKTIKYRGPKTISHIRQHSRKEAERHVAEIVRYAEFCDDDPDYDDIDRESLLLGHGIERELLRQYDKGIVSLAERADCPLMWSHYGDQHHGVCIGYSVPDRAADSLHKIEYGGSRLVEASKVAAMIEGNVIARVQVDKAVLLRKAPSWEYEREWRLIGHRGPHVSRLELEEVIFGMRCLDSVKYAVFKALKDRKRPAKFYSMHEVEGTFDLEKVELVENDELFDHFPCCHLATLDMFDVVEGGFDVTKSQ